jgi:predicted enzyme related to lactoylglutathione lyase
MANHVTHFEILVASNPDAAFEFYADAFGWKIDADNPMHYGLVDTGGGIGGGIGQSMDGKTRVTFYVEVDDPQAMLDKIGKLGGKTIMPPMDVPGGEVRIAMFEDPAGNQVGLVKQLKA